MENAKQVGSSPSSFTLDLFGPKDSSSSSSSTGLFGSIFGPSSTGLGRDSSLSGVTGSWKKQDLGGQYDNAKHGTSGYMTQSGGIRCKDSSSIYQNETVEPCYFSSSIYYGGQEVYSSNSQTTTSQHIFKKDGGVDDQNGNNTNSASRGNWWQGMMVCGVVVETFWGFII
ncbi:unnamed protein product [Ilex paraguariensis]|uniref:Uncharacterized protein n=1 Tax=Ilex paraguariensis TaxID=185542 RepID=A0ABC8QTD7_9AQUA